MCSNSRPWAWTVMVAAWSVVFAGRAQAEDPATCTAANTGLAERRAGEAFEAYGKGEYPKAVTLYLDAYAACPSAPILYNLARIHDTKLDDRNQAMVFYRRYVASVDARPDLVVTARKRLEELQPSKPTASPVVTASPAEHVARESRPGSGGAPPPPRDMATPQSGWSNQRWLGAMLGVGGVVGLGVGSVFGMLARSQANSAHELCDGNVCRSQEGVDAAKAGQRDATISNVGFAAGAALLFTGAVLYVTGGDARATETQATALHLTAGPQADAWAWALGGTW